jgi:hypothetical protein
MRPHGRVLMRRWVMALGAVLLIAAHGFVFRALSELPLSVIIVSGMIILIAIMHAGLLGRVYTRFRRRSGP